MIDNIKFNILNKNEFEQNLERKGLINFKSTYNVITGEANDYPKVGKLENMEIRITKKGAIIKGSIHKYYNSIIGSGNHNHSDFSFRNWGFAINDLCEKLEIDKDKTKLTNLEFGFNITVIEKPKQLIEKNILMLDLKDHNRRHNYRGKGSYKEFEKTDYSLKLYDKGKQYKLLDKNLLRIELKITSSRYLKKLGIINLNHLGYYAFNGLFEALLKHFNNIMIVDSIKAPKGIREDQMILFKNCINPNHWNGLHAKEKKETYREFVKIMKKYNQNTIHSNLRDSIINKYHLLMNIKSLQYD